MRYHAYKKVSRWPKGIRTKNNTLYVPLPYGGGHNKG